MIVRKTALSNRLLALILVVGHLPRARLPTQFLGCSDSGGAERPSSGSSGAPLTSRTSVASISVPVSTARVIGGFAIFTLSRAFFAPGLSFALAGRLRGIALATIRFTGLFRTDLEGLRALRRAIDFLFRTAGRFFR